LPSHREALNVLLIALQNGEGFIKITGNVGAGKTMLCRKLLNELQLPFVTAYIPNPHLTATGLHMSIANELGISFSRETGKTHLLQLLNKHLLDNAEKLQKTVLIIDEAQAMPLETLEALRLLTNLETEKQKLLQIVLFGQPELNTRLQKRSIRQLRQRISFSYALKELTPIDVGAYIKHRLIIADSANPAFFSSRAINALHFYSRGIPRLINILAHKALLSAYGSGLQKIGVKQIRLAAKDTEDTCKLKQPFECRKQLVIALLLSLCILAFNQFNSV
jgi:MSHA biogenesis protein MshM